jgi:ferritin-like metal-binding protein YciE
MVNVQERPGATKIRDLEQKFIYEICGIYDAEIRFLEAQQMMLQCVKNSQLKSMISSHIQETQQQIKNLEQVFSTMGQQPQRINCDAAAGLVSDGQKLMLLTAESPEILDLCLANGQAKVEQFEITCYRALVKGAEQMQQKQVMQLLQQNLQQEEQTFQKIEQSIPQLLQQAMSTSGNKR